MNSQFNKGDTVVIMPALKCEKCHDGGVQSALRGSCPEERVLRKRGWRTGQSGQRSHPEAEIFELGS